MKPGDLIGIGKRGEKHIGLLCEVTDIDGEGVKFWVINGAWYGVLTPNSTVLSFRGDEVMAAISDCKVLYEGPILNRNYNYNDAMAYMSAQLRRPLIARWWVMKRYHMGQRLDRFRRACRAFCDVWQGKKMVDLDDTIPF